LGSPGALVAAWRDKAAVLRRYAPEVANALEDAAGELEACLRDTGADLLTLQAAARESGYTADHLGRLIRSARLENHGRANAPKVRRGDLPKKAAKRARLALQPGGAHMEALTREAIASTRRRSA
jgi:uncharacterized protein GlcG (DUF336 family)